MYCRLASTACFFCIPTTELIDKFNVVKKQFLAEF